MEPMSKVQEIHAEILAKRKEIDAIELELAQSLVIQEMIPTAFDHGRVRIKWTSALEGLRGTVIDGNGDEHPLPDDAAARLSVCAEDLTPKK